MFGIDPTMPLPVSINIPQAPPLPALSNMQTPPLPQFKAGGMFGGGGDWRTALAAAAAGFLSRRNPQAAQMVMQPVMQKRQMQMQQQQQANELQRQKDLYTFELQNPKPTNNDTANDYAFWQQHLSPEQFQQWLQKQYDPDVSIPLPGGALYVGPRSGLPAAMGRAQPPSAPVGPVRDYVPGGPTQPASGGFPR